MATINNVDQPVRKNIARMLTWRELYFLQFVSRMWYFTEIQFFPSVYEVNSLKEVIEFFQFSSGVFRRDFGHILN